MTKVRYNFVVPLTGHGRFGGNLLKSTGKDSMEIYIEGDAIILRKYQPACIFCDSAKDIVSYRGKNVCSDCIRMLEEKV